MDEQNNYIEKVFNQFLENYEFEKHLMEEENLILVLYLDQIKNFNEELYISILNNPVSHMTKFEKIALDKYNELTNNQSRYEKIKIHFNGYLGKNSVSPRELKSNLINKLVSVSGIVSSIRKKKPKLIKSVHKTTNYSRTIVKEYRDQYSLNPENNNYNLNNGIPLMDENKKALMMEFGLSDYYDIQTIVLQEIPENIPSGLLSRSIEVILKEELVEKVRPGERVLIHGIYKTKNSFSSSFSGLFKTYLLATNIEILNINKVSKCTYNDINNIKEISKRKDLYELLIKSVAPSIEGNNHIKFSILLQLAGGLEKKLNNGTKLRGDVHVLLIGDPSTAKSQLLRRVLNLTPISISTNGRGSSGVGLTAIVSFDPETKEKNLEAGTLVLADKGIVCIDEFDKMNEIDKVQMHEVMEQQTITINKAGIHSVLNARCSILAAANPIYGEYIEDYSPEFNISMQPSLLSRFDLIFIVLDTKDIEKDKMISKKVTYNHKIGKPRDFILKGKEVTFPENNETKDEDPFEYYGSDSNNNLNEILKQDFWEKYISYCKNTINPELTDESNEYLVKKWKFLRLKDDDYKTNKTFKRTMPITIRTLESLIRLSTGAAKLRLSNIVELEDCELAFFLFLKSYSNEFDIWDNNSNLKEKYFYLFDWNISKNKNKPNKNGNSKENNNKNNTKNNKKREKKENFIDNKLYEEEEKDEEIPNLTVNKVFTSLVSFEKNEVTNGIIITDEFLTYINKTHKLKKENLLELLDDLENKGKLMYIKKYEKICLI